MICDSLQPVDSFYLEKLEKPRDEEENAQTKTKKPLLKPIDAL
ncbi:MAG: hypothetical protein QXS38_00355 [Candidatus Pacearchaeota archaeon]